MNIHSVSVTQYFLNPEPIEEDPDSSERIFTTKSADTQLETYSLFDRQHHLSAVESVLDMYEQIQSFPYIRAHAAIQSFCHLTLPEALIYDAIFREITPRLGFTVSLEPIPEKSSLQTFSLKLSFYNRDKRGFLSYVLRYTPKACRCQVLLDHKDIGHLTYVIRGAKLEEITGTLDRLPLVIDPVWHPQDPHRLREEHLTIGSFRSTFIYRDAHKTGSFKGKAISVQQYTPQQKDRQTILEKELQFLGVHGKSSLLFMRGVLIPVSGQWTFDPIA